MALHAKRIWVDDEGVMHQQYIAEEEFYVKTTPDPTEDALVAALVVLARFGIDPDIQELLVAGNPQRGIPPGALKAVLTRTPTTEAGVSLEEVREVLLDAEALLCEGIEDSPTVREVLKRVRTILTRIKNEAPRD